MKPGIPVALAVAGALVVLGGSAVSAQNPAAATQANASPLPGMPPVTDPNDIYANDHAGKLADAVKGFPALV